MQLLRYRFCPSVFVFLFLLFCSCKLPLAQEDAESSVDESYAGKERRDFYAINALSNAPYSVRGVHLAENDVCIVYGEYSAKVPLSTAEEIAREYAERIAPSITGVFGNYYPKNKKLIILLLDILDGYSKNDGTYVAGYFSVKDIFPKNLMSGSNEASNEEPMLYIDINPGKPGDDNFYPTIAHELQHLINFSSRYEKSNPDLDSIKTQEDIDQFIASVQQDDWVDEGLSSAAEYIYSKASGNGHIQDKIKYYNEAKNYYDKGQSNIARGNNFFTWGENDTFLYDDYATVYLFFQWLRIHANGTSIYRAIIESEYTDYRAVTTAARQHIPGLFEEMDSTDDQSWEWERLLETWLAANYINAPKKEDTGGLFGYNSEFTLSPVMLGGKNVSLYPGEGVYSELEGELFSYPQSSPTHIRYAGLDGTENLINRISQDISGRGNALLTFNANSTVTRNKYGVPTNSELGTLTGIASPERPAPGRTTGLPAKPLPIDIRPPLRF
ncbi:MAG: hypothetical protein LBE10_00600 [Treponema sp.]|jgi:hypothetical protein|nr:hypothetical protein [Treponema sp.]